VVEEKEMGHKEKKVGFNHDASIVAAEKAHLGWKQC